MSATAACDLRVTRRGVLWPGLVNRARQDPTQVLARCVEHQQHDGAKQHKALVAWQEALQLLAKAFPWPSLHLVRLHLACASGARRTSAARRAGAEPDTFVPSGSATDIWPLVR